MYGPIAPLADENGQVSVMLGETPLREAVQELTCADLEGIMTPPSDEERFRED